MEYKRYGKNEDLYRANATEDEPTLKIIMEGTHKGRHFVIGAHRLGNEINQVLSPVTALLIRSLIPV